MKLFILFFSIALVSGCDSTSGPNGSWLVGDPDKGVYVLIEDNNNSSDRVYKGVIYSVSDESVIFKGEFDYSKHTQINYQNSSIYLNWDGERLYLKDNSFLKAIK